MLRGARLAWVSLEEVHITSVAMTGTVTSAVATRASPGQEWPMPVMEYQTTSVPSVHAEVAISAAPSSRVRTAGSAHEAR
jgi:hypothetical protein